MFLLSDFVHFWFSHLITPLTTATSMHISMTDKNSLGGTSYSSLHADSFFFDSLTESKTVESLSNHFVSLKLNFSVTDSNRFQWGDSALLKTEYDNKSILFEDHLLNRMVFPQVVWKLVLEMLM
jgi:hypothetical protein